MPMNGFGSQQQGGRQQFNSGNYGGGMDPSRGMQRPAMNRPFDESAESMKRLGDMKRQIRTASSPMNQAAGYRRPSIFSQY